MRCGWPATDSVLSRSGCCGPPRTKISSRSRPTCSIVHPVETVGLLGRVYRGDRPPPASRSVEQVDPNVELRVHLLPAPRPYTLEWSGPFASRPRRPLPVRAEQPGASTLWLDGAEVAQKGVDAGPSRARLTWPRLA